jgi:hypothetical protein
MSVVKADVDLVHHNCAPATTGVDSGFMLQLFTAGKLNLSGPLVEVDLLYRLVTTTLENSRQRLHCSKQTLLQYAELWVTDSPVSLVPANEALRQDQYMYGNRTKKVHTPSHC